MEERRKELTKKADEILGVSRGPGRPSNAAKEKRLLSERAVDMVLDGDRRPLTAILQSLQSAGDEKRGESSGTFKGKTKETGHGVYEEKSAVDREKKGEGGTVKGGKHTSVTELTVTEDKTKKSGKGEALPTGKPGKRGGIVGDSSAEEDGACAGRERRSKKQTMLVKVQGAASMDPSTVLTTLGHLVRDDAIARRREEVIQCHATHSYYLRPRKPPPVDHVDEVDHTFECQMLAHAIFQTPEYHPILKQLDINTSSHSLKRQPFVVQGALETLKNIQNCVDDPTLFNLRMLNKSLNITKGAVIKRWLNDRVVSNGSHLQKADLQEAYRKSTSVQNGIIDVDEADELAVILAKDLTVAEKTYVHRLDKAEEMVGMTSTTVTDKRVQKNRLIELKETISGLQEEHMDW